MDRAEAEAASMSMGERARSLLQRPLACLPACPGTPHLDRGSRSPVELARKAAGGSALSAGLVLSPLQTALVTTAAAALNTQRIYVAPPAAASTDAFALGS